MAVKDAVGRYGERVAARHLLAAGWTLVDRNWRSPSRELRGELDLIALDGSTLVVVEVKTRRSVNHGSGLEAVTPLKLRRLRRLAGVWIATARPADPSTGQPADTAATAPHRIRIDVVAVQLHPVGAPDVIHVRGVG